ncbi:MAG: outer membrane beta-barrel protein [Paramuribaculum sp.]|nr:outer membrane beta-barrel protein [Paramuribaculum sp.]
MFQLFFRVMLLSVMFVPMITASAAVVRGSVIDSDKEPMAQATVRLLSSKDSTFIKGVKTNNAGNYTLSDVKSGKYVIEAKYLGYNNGYTQVSVSAGDVNVSPIVLSESTIMLSEVKVTGVKTAVKVMEDTVEFNADSYKTQPNAVVEDLLKRLPGVEVDSDGKITANGSEVKKILIDGKEFFSDDPKVASKNLPVNMVDKLQVVERKSDLARLTGVDDGEDETVINLTTKPGMKNGYFGVAEAGYGTDSRYKGSFNVNRFWNNNQVTLLGNFNNINELGFTDSNGNRFRRFGGSNGINTSQSVGVNFNVGKEEIIRVGGDVMYSHTDRESIERRKRQYLFADSTSWANTDKSARDRSHNFRADFRVLWKPDSFNTIDFRPNISYNVNNSVSLDSTLTMAGDAKRSLVNGSYNNQNSRGHSLEYGASLLYNHNFRQHRGRSFSVHLRYQHSNVTEDENTYSRNRFYNFDDSVNIYDQWTDNHTWSDMAQLRATWTEPLGDASKGHFLTLAYRIQYRWNNADKLVYDHPLLYPDGSGGAPVTDYDRIVLNDTLSNRFRNDFLTQDIRLGYKFVSRKHNLEAGLSFVPSSSKSDNLIDSRRNVERNVWNIAPFIRYRYKLNKAGNISVNYRARASQPSMSQLQPVVDRSDPMRIVVGNPGLNPSFTHYLRLQFRDFNQEAQRSIMMMGDFDVTQNSIVSRTVFNPKTGTQTTYYQNVNGVWSGRLMAMFSQPLRNKAWQVSVHTFGMYNRRVGFNNGERNTSGSLLWNIAPSISFRPDNFEFELRPRYSLQHTVNSLSSQQNLTVHNFGGAFSVYYYTPIGIVLNSDINYTAKRGYGAGFDDNEWMWNASISYSTLRDKSLTFSLKAYDLLQQRSNVSRSVTANYIDDLRYNDLTRYFMVTVAYKFNTFGKGNQPQVPGDDMRRGPFGPPPGGGRPH